MAVGRYSLLRWEGWVFLAYYAAYAGYLVLDATRKARQGARRASPVQTLGSGEIEERLIDRDRLDERRRFRRDPRRIDAVDFGKTAAEVLDGVVVARAVVGDDRVPGHVLALPPPHDAGASVNRAPCVCGRPRRASVTTRAAWKGSVASNRPARRGSSMARFNSMPATVASP